MSKEASNKDFLKFWEHMPLQTKDETLIVLKGHLLLEDLMREYCASKVKNESALEEARLTFRQVLGLTQAFMPYQSDSWVWKALTKINQIRNRLAHNLSPKDYELLRNKGYLQNRVGNHAL